MNFIHGLGLNAPLRCCSDSVQSQNGLPSLRSSALAKALATHNLLEYVLHIEPRNPVY